MSTSILKKLKIQADTVLYLVALALIIRQL
jgi:hypothetical protein